MDDKRLFGFMFLFVLSAYAVQTLYVLSIDDYGNLIGAATPKEEIAEVANETAPEDSGGIVANIWRLIYGTKTPETEDTNQTEGVEADAFADVEPTTGGLKNTLLNTGSRIWDIVSFNVWAGMEEPEVVPAPVRNLVQLLIALPINTLGIICIIELFLQFVPFVGG